MSEIISTLISILGIMGLSDLQTSIKNKKASQNGVSEDDILKVINAINNETRNLNDDKISLISNKLNSIQYPAGMSDNVKNALTNSRNQLSRKYTKVSKDISKVERELNNIDERARTFMSLDPSTRISQKQVLRNLVTEAAQHNSDAGGSYDISQVENVLNDSSQQKDRSDNIFIRNAPQYGSKNI